MLLQPPGLNSEEYVSFMTTVTLSFIFVQSVSRLLVPHNPKQPDTQPSCQLSCKQYSAKG
uniref:Uncharacterized protein n=1 Tax=Arundo donax TaxID=35708 RepID=A0A0A9AYX6_ARUDO